MSASIPPPEPGDVINYIYLFAHEAAAGRDEGVKERPVLVIASDAMGVAVVPITTKGEARSSRSDRIPDPVAKAMGLPRAGESHVVVNDVNDFDWRGHDVIDLKTGSFLYGRCPPTYFQKIVRAVQASAALITDRR